MSKRAYLDHNATAPLLLEAREAMLAALDLPGNPSSVHADGRAARALVERARGEVARLVSAAPAHVIFTSGATEAAATLLSPRYRMGRSPLAVDRLFVSAIEHPCVLSGGRFPAEAVERMPVNGDGVLDLDALEAALASQAAGGEGGGRAMVAVMLANNETGVIQPIAKVAEIVHRHGGLMVVDAVQAAGRIPISVEELGADFVFLSSHKMGGPKGAGAIVTAGEILMPEPLVPGGGQEKGHRSGTENLSAIAGFGGAAGIARQRASDNARLAAMRERIEAGILAILPEATIYGAGAPRLPNTTFFAFPRLKAETAQIGFDLEGVAVSAGSACSSGKVGPSHVLEAMGADARHGAIRVSIGPETTEEEIGTLLTAMRKLKNRSADRRSQGERSAA